MISNELYYFSLAPSEIVPNRTEALRYMGINNSLINDEFEKIYSECLELLEQSAVYKAVVSPISFEAHGDDIGLPFASVHSHSLALNLSGSNIGFAFAATAGTGIDRLIFRLSRSNRGKAVVLDAIASTGIEAFCDAVNSKFAAGSELRHRFSPGYGDLSLEIQPALLEYLDASRKIGINLTDNLFMTPSKSVTAIFGIK